LQDYGFETHGRSLPGGLNNLVRRNPVTLYFVVSAVQTAIAATPNAVVGEFNNAADMNCIPHRAVADLVGLLPQIFQNLRTVISQETDQMFLNHALIRVLQ
jgi:hypothetical protein